MDEDVQFPECVDGVCVGVDHEMVFFWQRPAAHPVGRAALDGLVAVCMCFSFVFIIGLCKLCERFRVSWRG